MQIPVLFMKSHVDAFTRKDGVVVAAHDTKVTAKTASVPPISTHADALHAFAKKTLGRKKKDADSEMFSRAATHMKNGDHKALADIVGGEADTWQREQILDHVHPHHWDSLNSGALDMDRSVRDYHAKFGGAPKGEDAKPAFTHRPAPSEGEIGHHEHSTYGVHFQPGDHAKDGAGNVHKVLSHSGPTVLTEGGAKYHPTKLTPVPAPAAAKPAAAKPAGKPKAKAAAKPAAKGDEHAEHREAMASHPNVIGKAKPAGAHSFDFDGKKYNKTFKEGTSFADGTPVAEHESDDGHRVWKDAKDRVHADSTGEVPKYKAKWGG